MPAYYNEVEPYAARWLRNLVSAGLVPAGDVDDRSICDVQPDDLRGYGQCHFFAGIGGWAYAARLAGWPDDRPLWTGSCPCQPFSVAGRGAGTEDERHLWPEFFRLIRDCRPPVVMGEQVAAAVGKDWLDGVLADMEGVGYACGAAVVPACAVDAPHRRDRLWFVARRSRDDVAHAGASGLSVPQQFGEPGAEECRLDQRAAAPKRGGACGAGAVGHPEEQRSPPGCRFPGDNFGPCELERSSPWGGVAWIAGADGRARRLKPGLRLLADGVPARVGRIRAYGNAVVPQVAAEVIGAYMECMP